MISLKFATRHISNLEEWRFNSTNQTCFIYELKISLPTENMWSSDVLIFKTSNNVLIYNAKNTKVMYGLSDTLQSLNADPLSLGSTANKQPKHPGF